MDPQNFINAVIDEASFDNIVSYIEYAKNSKDAEIVFGGTYDKSIGYFVAPTLILTTDPHFKSMEEEISVRCLLFMFTRIMRFLKRQNYVILLLHMP